MKIQMFPMINNKIKYHFKYNQILQEGEYKKQKKIYRNNKKLTRSKMQQIWVRSPKNLLDLEQIAYLDFKEGSNKKTLKIKHKKRISLSKTQNNQVHLPEEQNSD